LALACTSGTASHVRHGVDGNPDLLTRCSPLAYPEFPSTHSEIAHGLAFDHDLPRQHPPVTCQAALQHLHRGMEGRLSPEEDLRGQWVVGA
jgi:hypothetical protein